MLQRIDLRGANKPFASLLPRFDVSAGMPTAAVREILSKVRDGGDEAVRSLTSQFDGVDIADFRVAPEILSEAWEALDKGLASALQVAHDRILEFHQGERAQSHEVTQDAITVLSVPQPVERAGLYIPGGLASYPSTVLMTALPARAAGVNEIVICTPPNPRGETDQAVLAAAYLCGVDELYKIGGVQAIGAMAYGTESMRAVDVIAGPGNAWVATAKQEVAGTVGIAAAFAGPSEIVVVGDESCPTSSAAVDLVLQAEHGPGGRAWLVTWNEKYAHEVESAIEDIVSLSPRRNETLETLTDGGYLCLVDGPADAVEVVNVIAPEHLQLMCDNAKELAGSIRNAGAVFIGNWAPASIGDYVAGPSHVLPTAGTARFSGALTVDDFQKRMHVIEVSKEGFDTVGSAVSEIAEAEGLWAHAASVRERERWANEGIKP
ncbi:MAG: histidinol dehydrogenase [Acidimicrobiaceae bacterium]|nr:histidinol dehydrogenase [Acidimicrobiaceae bacterium]MEC7427026.1 histidinol dehydrogenase [Actinomycetota bacterium]HAQ44164.1 histidinol dehydrogenase [Acidimicrobiaceae bacterium]